jgi:hypothetical protein
MGRVDLVAAMRSPPGEVSVLRRPLLTVPLTLALAASAAEAQVTIGRGPYGLTLEGAIETVASAFPVVRRLMGDRCFRVVARRHAAEVPSFVR